MVAHLERYRAEMDAPVLEGVEVQALEPRGEGFELSTSVGPMSARSVVVCTGAYQRALSPPGTDGLPAHVTMLDTRAYRNPAMVPDGDVLVVGSGQSGCQIAEDLVRRWSVGDPLLWQGPVGPSTGSATTTCSGGCWKRGSCRQGSRPSPPRRPASPPTSPPAGSMAATTGTPTSAAGQRRHPGGALRGRGGRTAAVPRRPRREHRRGEMRATATSPDRLSGSAPNAASRLRDLPEPAPFVEDPSPATDARSIGTIIFSGGFRPDYSWVHVAGGFDPMGFPAQVDGASTAVPGLFFVGVHFLRTHARSPLPLRRRPGDAGDRGRQPSRGIWPRTAPAQRDRTVHDPRPSTSASPPK